MATDYSNILKDIEKKMKSFKGKACKHCKSTKKTVNKKGLCPSCEETLSEKRKAALASKRNSNSEGYVYVYDENGRSVLEHRLVMERMLGRKLQSHEVVLKRNGKKDDNSPENLVLGIKNGTPLENLTCCDCGSVGNFIYVPPQPVEQTVEPRLVFENPLIQ